MIDRQIWTEDPRVLMKNRYLSNPGKSMKDARTLAEEVLRRPLSMGERMILRQFLYEAMSDLKRCNTFFDLFEPHREAVARYVHYFPQPHDSSGIITS